MSEYLLRLKLLLRDKTALICYGLAVAVIVSVILGLNMHSEERSSLPIGLINEDNSPESENLRKEILKSKALYVYEGSRDYLQSLFLDGYINSLFIIKEGYGDNVKLGNTAELISIYSAEDDKISTVVGDIIAGCMLFEICIDKTYNRYMALNKLDGIEKLTYSEYCEYVEELSGDDSFAFSFDVSYIDAGTGATSAHDVTNGMVYRQMIAGMLAMLIMLIAFCSCNAIAGEYESGVRRRLFTIGRNVFLAGFREISAVATFMLPMIILMSVLFLKCMTGTEVIKLLCLNICFMLFGTLLFYILVRLSKNVFMYQFVSSFVVIGFGILGFISVFEGLLGSEIFGATPIAYYIELFIGIGG